MTHNPPTNQLDLDAIEARAARLYERTATIDPNAHPDFGQLTDADVPALVDEVRRLRAQGAAIEGLERAFTAELDDTNALALVDALIVLRSKLPCTCARSRGLHEKACQRYVPGHDLLSGQSRLAQARAEMRPAVRPAVETGA